MNGKVVVDSSVAVKWQLNDEDHVEEATALLRDLIAGKLKGLVPFLYQYEVVSAVLKATQSGRISPDDAQEAIGYLLSVRVELVEFAEMAQRAFRLAQQFKQSIYDISYVALAEQEGCDFWTGDEALLKALRKRFSFIHWIGQYRSPR